MRIEELDGVDGPEEQQPQPQPQPRGREIVGLKAKRALVGAGARILFYPTLLYNLFRNRIEPEFRWWDQVDQFILLGAVPFPGDVPLLQQLGVRGVVTLNEPYETLVPSSLYQAYRIDHLVIPTRDYLFAPSLEDICRAVDFIHWNASHGRTTYVHCKAGRGRSTTIVLCYLIEHKHMTPEAALSYVRSRRPRVLLAPSQWRAVQIYSRCRSESASIQSTRPPRSRKHGTMITPSDLELARINRHATEDLVLSFCQIEQPSPISSPSRDEEMMLITESDLEGYDIYADSCRGMQVSSKAVVCSKPMIMRRISCLFGSLKISCSCQPASRLCEVHAC